MSFSVRSNTPPLERLQADFQAYILGDDRAMDGKVRATAKADAATLLRVYRDAYALRLIEALETNFLRLKRVLGEDDFDRLARAYIAAHPSRHFSIRWFGGALAGFLSEETPWSDTPALGELARLEWALAGAFDAADAEPLDVAAIAAVAPADWPSLVLTFHPSLETVVSRWTVPELWNALGAEDEDADIPPPEARDTPVSFAVWRRDGETFFRSMTDDEAWALDAARQGSAFGALCEGLCGFIPADQAGARAAALLRGWVESGWVMGIRIAAT